MVRRALRRTVHQAGSTLRTPEGVCACNTCTSVSAPQKLKATASLHRLAKRPSSSGMAAGAMRCKRRQLKSQGKGLEAIASRRSSIPASVSSMGHSHMASLRSGTRRSTGGAAGALGLSLSSASLKESHCGSKPSRWPPNSCTAWAKASNWLVARYRSSKAAVQDQADSGATCGLRKASSKLRSAPASSPLAKRIAASSSSGSVRRVSPSTAANRREVEKPGPPGTVGRAPPIELGPTKASRCSGRSLDTDITPWPISVGRKSATPRSAGTVFWRLGGVASVAGPASTLPCKGTAAVLNAAGATVSGSAGASILPFHHWRDIWASISSIFFSVTARPSWSVAMLF